MNPTVSIIIPVYNAQQYLRRCVESILGQEYTDFELLLIDDGSRDGSAAICDEYGAKDARVRVIHKENEGVSAARNLAIDNASGTWLQFVDSDDWITPDATKLLVRIAEEEECDLVISDFYRVAGERVSQKGDIEEDGVLTREQFAAHMMENPADFYYGVLWNKLYRREIIQAHRLRMNTAISWCEDFMFNLEYIRYAERFCSLRAPVYYYVKRKGSLVSQGNSIAKTIQMKLTVFEYYHSFYKEVLDEEEYEKKRLQVYRFLVDAAGDGTVGIPFLPGTKRLGDERSGVSAEAIAGEGLLSEIYRERKLLERYLEVAALKNDLTVQEAALLLCLSHSGEIVNRRELADFAGLPRRTLTMLLQRLAMRGLIKQEDLTAQKQEEKNGKEKKKKEKKKERKDREKGKEEKGKKYRITFLPAADPVLEELSLVERDFDDARFGGFDEEELIQYTRLSEKMKRNMQRILYPGRNA